MNIPIKDIQFISGQQIVIIRRSANGMVMEEVYNYTIPNKPLKMVNLVGIEIKEGERV